MNRDTYLNGVEAVVQEYCNSMEQAYSRSQQIKLRECIAERVVMNYTKLLSDRKSKYLIKKEEREKRQKKLAEAELNSVEATGYERASASITESGRMLK